MAFSTEMNIFVSDAPPIGIFTGLFNFDVGAALDVIENIADAVYNFLIYKTISQPKVDAMREER